MRYLFFDIECADGNFKICEYGYVITNDKFQILQKQNYLINPQCQFNLTGREGQEDLILSYPEEEYRKHPIFEEMYDNIKFLMTQKDLMIFGHAVRNDIGFLDKSCRYRKVAPFNYVAYDIQKMLPIFSKTNRRFTSLHKAFDSIVPEEEKKGLISHRACDDAHETMLVLKWMSKELGFTVSDIVEACPDCKLDAFEYLRAAKESARIRNKKRSDKEALKKGREVYSEFLKPYEPLWESADSIGRFVTVSMNLKQKAKKLDEAMKLIRISNLVPVEKTPGSDYLIVLDEEDAAFVKEKMRHPYRGKIVTLAEFSAMNSGL